MMRLFAGAAVLLVIASGFSRTALFCSGWIFGLLYAAEAMR